MIATLHAMVPNIPIMEGLMKCWPCSHRISFSTLTATKHTTPPASSPSPSMARSSPSTFLNILPLENPRALYIENSYFLLSYIAANVAFTVTANTTATISITAENMYMRKLICSFTSCFKYSLVSIFICGYFSLTFTLNSFNASANSVP